jgi:hypothetical protein
LAFFLVSAGGGAVGRAEEEEVPLEEKMESMSNAEEGLGAGARGVGFLVFVGFNEEEVAAEAEEGVGLAEELALLLGLADFEEVLDVDLEEGLEVSLGMPTRLFEMRAKGVGDR